MAQTIADFFDLLGRGGKPQFRPEPWYNRDGDSIHYHWREEEFYGDRIDDKLTVYRSTASDNAVGCEIKGVSALLKKLGDFGIAIGLQDGTPLAMFLFISQATADQSTGDPAQRQKTYRYVLEHVGNKKVAVPQEEVPSA